MDHHIETETLTKFCGRQRRVEDLTLGVGSGEVFDLCRDPDAARE